MSWYCEFCQKSCSMKRKKEHQQTKFHKKNEESDRRAADFENFITYNYRDMISQYEGTYLSHYLEMSTNIYKGLKKQFKEKYKNEI